MESVNKVRFKLNASERTSASHIKNSSIVMAFLILLAIAAFLISFTVGRYSIPLSQLLSIFAGKLFNLPAAWPEAVETVLFQVRIPRILTAMLVGGALALSGASYQGLFRNPMVSPDILGVSSGAGFGASLAILLSFGTTGIQLTAFLFGLGAVFLVFSISLIVGRKKNTTLVLVLTGMVVSSLFSSFTSMTKYVADTESKLPDITFWLMGSLARSRNLKDVGIFLIPLALGAIPIILLRWRMNVLSFGEEEAQALGVNTKRIRIVIIICSTLLTAASVSVSGMIGWIGLIIPHIARLLVGPDYKRLIPASLLIGSSFLMLVDDIARSAFSIEIPLGILTSLTGAPFFIYLLLKGRNGWT